nr:putative E3 ubiquitin-protein ligase XBAT35 isoform X1 [Ipomoea trifida]
MGQQQSKDELLYRHAVDGNIEAISTLRRDGASLEWVDREGKTPLMTACMSSERFATARTLIELGADVNAYRPGHNAGTPLHHAASRGLDNIVQLLLFHGANALIKNDDSQTPLQVARVKGFSNVVRTIESHICIFSGWLREFYGPSFLEVLAPKLLSRKIWAVVVPHDSTKPLKLELAIYSSLQIYFGMIDALLANEVLPEEYRNRQQVTRPDIANNFQMRVLESAAETAAEAMELARGISASIQSSTEAREPRTLIDHSSEAKNANGWGSVVRPTPSDMSFQGWGDEPPKVRDNEWRNGVDGSNHYGKVSPQRLISSELSCNGWIDKPPPVDAMAKVQCNGWESAAQNPTQDPRGSTSRPTSSDVCSSEWMDNPTKENSKRRDNVHGRSPGKNQLDNSGTQDGIHRSDHTRDFTVPSAPPAPEAVLSERSVHYPTIDLTPVEFSSSPVDEQQGLQKTDKLHNSPLCIICWESPVEAACVPCGHMFGCLSCSNDIKSRKGDCPVCRQMIDQVGETVRDVVFLHNELFFAAAQKKSKVGETVRDPDKPVTIDNDEERDDDSDEIQVVSEKGQCMKSLEEAQQTVFHLEEKLLSLKGATIAFVEAQQQVNDAIQPSNLQVDQFAYCEGTSGH